MKTVRFALLILAASLPAAHAPAQATTPATHSALSNFDFSYAMPSGDRLGVSQVFDDGRRTYFAVGSPSVVPVVMAGLPGQEILVAAELRAPYLIANGTARRFVLRDGARSAEFLHSNQSRPTDVKEATRAVVTPARMAAMPAPALLAAEREAYEREVRASIHRPSYGSVAPVMGDAPSLAATVERDELHVPFRRDSATPDKSVATVLRGGLSAVGTIHRVIVTGRQDDGEADGLAQRRAAALRSEVVAAGVPAARVEVREGFKLFDDVASRPTSQVVVLRTPIMQPPRLLAAPPPNPPVAQAVTASAPPAPAAGPAAAPVAAVPVATSAGTDASAATKLPTGEPISPKARPAFQLAVPPGPLLSGMTGALARHSVQLWVSPDDPLVAATLPAEIQASGATLAEAIDALLRQARVSGGFLDRDQRVLGVTSPPAPFVSRTPG